MLSFAPPHLHELLKDLLPRVHFSPPLQPNTTLPHDPVWSVAKIFFAALQLFLGPQTIEFLWEALEALSGPAPLILVGALGQAGELNAFKMQISQVDGPYGKEQVAEKV